MIVSVVTPSLNKSFKFQSDWPYNNSQVYLLSSILEDLKEDEERTFEANDNNYVFTSKVHYPNNKDLVSQNVYMNKDSRINKVEVVDADNNVLISMDFKTIEYNKKFGEDYFELNSIISNSVNDDKEDKSDKKDSSNDSLNNKKDNVSDNNEGPTGSSSNSDEKENGVKEKSDSTSTNTNNDTNNNVNTNTNSNTNNNINTNNDNEKVDTKETLSIEDVIYPMYLPENTYLTSQERVNIEKGERLILTFGGDNSFVLVEETIADNDSNLIIPVSGEFDFLSDVIGVIGNKSVMWYSNGIEYYMTSNTLEVAELVDIARSISVLPVSK